MKALLLTLAFLVGCSQNGEIAALSSALMTDGGADATSQPHPGEIVIRTGEKVVFWGDSITSPYAWMTPLLYGIYGEFDPWGQTRPNFLNVGINGAKYSTYNNTNYHNHFIDPFADAKAAIIFLGVNDVLQQPPTSDVQFEADVNEFYDYLHSVAPNMHLLVLSPWLIGEAKPDGSNAKDAELDAKRDIVQRVCAQRGIAFVDLRTAWFADDVTLPFTTADNLYVHPNGVGSGWLSEQARHHIQVRF